MPNERKRFHNMHSATFWRIFANYAAPALLLILGVFLLMFVRRSNERRQEAVERHLEAVDTITQTLEGMLSERIIGSEQLHNTYWVQKQFLEEGVLEELSPMEMRYQTENTLLQCNGYTLEKNVCLYFPMRDHWVAYHSHTSTRDYLGILGIAEEDRAQFLSEITGSAHLTLVSSPAGSFLKDCLVLALPLENVRRPRGYVIYALDRARLVSRLRAMMPEAMRLIRVLDGDGKEILRVGEDGTRMEIHRRQSAYIPWTYEFSIDPSLYALSGMRAQPATLLYVSVLLLALGVFYLVALKVYAPIGRLARDVAGGATHARQNDYQVIGQSFERLQAQVADEKRFSALQSLLLGCFDQSESTLSRGALPFTQDMWFQVLLVREEGDESLRALGRAMKVIGGYNRVRFERVAVEGNGILILGYGDEQTGRELGAQILSGLEKEGIEAIAGRLRPGLVGISISYQDCLASRVGDAAVRYYFPLEWENQLISALRAGNRATAENICDALRRENGHRMEKGAMAEADLLAMLRTILSDLHRVAQESGMDPLPDDQPDQPGWERIGVLVGLVCAHTGRLHPAEKSLGQQLVEYIDEYTCDPSLSLTRLEERFHISPGTVNKYLKAETGSPFLTYLTARRVNRAKELLSLGHSVGETAQLCGYENEQSFRRVFYRVAGIRAQDYPEQKGEP